MADLSQELQQQVGATSELLSTRGLSLATAESCTGGWVAKAMTDRAGSSSIFECGLVTYSNRAKQRLLGVKPDTLAQQGAVSQAVVEEMVLGLFQASDADVGVSISGIAGPGGGTQGKPVGTVWMAWGRDGRLVTSRCYRFDGDRDRVRLQSVIEALAGVQQLLLA